MLTLPTSISPVTASKERYPAQFLSWRISRV
ncbi:hypothetical protein LINGRAPRIM_LOCUS1436 [Linum grandiflorum]